MAQSNGITRYTAARHSRMALAEASAPLLVPPAPQVGCHHTYTCFGLGATLISMPGTHQIDNLQLLVSMFWVVLTYGTPRKTRPRSGTPRYRYSLLTCLRVYLTPSTTCTAVTAHHLRAYHNIETILN